MKNLFKERMESQALIGLRTKDQAWDELIIGLIQLIDNQHVILKEVDDYGAFIGETRIEWTEILSVEYDDPYQLKLKTLVDCAMDFSSDQEVMLRKKDTDLQVVLMDRIKDGILSTLFFNEDYYVTGKVIELNHPFISIQNIGENGEEDGYSMHLIEKLRGIRFYGKEELKIAYLLENKRK